MRQTADKYGVSKSNVANILHRRQEYLCDYTSNFNKRIKCIRKDENEQKINQLVFERFTTQRATRIPISRPKLQAKAKQLARFEASNSWLQKFVYLF